MAWVKEIGPGSARDGWRDDFPLAHELPDRIEIDCSRLQLPIHPMFAVRLRMFIEWHRGAGREVRTTPPSDSGAKRVFEAMSIDPTLPTPPEDDAIMPVTCMKEFLEVEEIAERTRELLEYQLHDVSPLGHAVFMAVSELCANAIDHGENDLGAFAAVRRVTEPRRQVTIAISDLGMGVPEQVLPATRFRRGTWITYDLVSV